MFTRTRKLPWPMSRIDRDCLHELWLEGQRSSKAITEIVAEAVVAHLNQRLEAATRAAEAGQSFQAQALPPAA